MIAYQKKKFNKSLTEDKHSFFEMHSQQVEKTLIQFLNM